MNQTLWAVAAAGCVAIGTAAVAQVSGPIWPGPKVPHESAAMTGSVTTGTAFVHHHPGFPIGHGRGQAVRCDDYEDAADVTLRTNGRLAGRTARSTWAPASGWTGTRTRTMTGWNQAPIGNPHMDGPTTASTTSGSSCGRVTRPIMRVVGGRTGNIHWYPCRPGHYRRWVGEYPCIRVPCGDYHDWHPTPPHCRRNGRCPPGSHACGYGDGCCRN